MASNQHHNQDHGIDLIKKISKFINSKTETEETANSPDEVVIEGIGIRYSIFEEHGVVMVNAISLKDNREVYTIPCHDLDSTKKVLHLIDSNFS
jgi:uncharacterized metal-binding protein